MFTSIRDWLFPKIPLVPIVYDEDGWQVCFGGARRHKTIRSDAEQYTFRCQYSPTHPFTGKGRASLSNPPLHWHRAQTEWFTVHQGRVGFVLDGKEHVASKGEEVEITSGRVHTFWCDPTCEEDLVMDITTRPGRGIEEQWITNFYGVLESAYQVGKMPSFLQAMVFCDEAISAPGGVPKPIGVLMAYLFGRYIGRLAGYSGSYPIYSQSRPPK